MYYLLLPFILVKPFIIKSGLKPIKVKVGEVVEMGFDYRGEPDPVAKWFKESTVSLKKKKKAKLSTSNLLINKKYLH